MDKENTYPISGAIALKVFSEGMELDCSEYLSSVSAHTEYQKIATARMVFDDGGLFDDAFKALPSEMLLPGKEIEIKAGYEQDTKTIFKGVIVSQAISLEGTSTEMIIEAKHKAYKMTLGKQFRSFEDMTDSDVLFEICSSYGIDISVDDTSANHEKLVQYNCSDWDFLNLRSEASGLLPFTSLDGISAKSYKDDGDIVLTLDNANTINRLQLEIDARYSIGEMNAEAWNYTLQDYDSYSSTGVSDKLPLGDLSGKSLAKAVGVDRLDSKLLAYEESSSGMESWSESFLTRRKLALIQGKLSVPGYAEIWPGDCIQFENLSARFNGKVPVTSVIQEISNGSWETTLGIGMDAGSYSYKYPDIDSNPADGLAAATHGLQIAKVQALEGDPLGEERIYIKLMGKEDALLWARLSAFDAGNGRGSVFNPEIGDEVIVGFVNANPSQAVVLGSLYSSNASAPHPKEDDNNTRGLVTKNGLKVTFDDADKVITLETAGGNRITLSDADKGLSLEDQSGNTVTLDTGGIKIESKGAIDIKASGDVNIEGTNINIKANAQMKAQGNASAEISSSGNTVVKGSIVQIN